MAVPIQSLKRLWTSQKSCFLNKWHELARFQLSILATLAAGDHQPTRNSKYKLGAPHHRAKRGELKGEKRLLPRIAHSHPPTQTLRRIDRVEEELLCNYYSFTFSFIINNNYHHIYIFIIYIIKYTLLLLFIIISYYFSYFIIVYY